MKHDREPTHLHHGKEVAEEAAEDPVLDEQDHEGDGQDQDALDDIAECEIDEVAVRLILVEPITEDGVDHETVGEQADRDDERVQEHEQRVEGGERVAELRFTEVEGVVLWCALVQVADHLL